MANYLYHTYILKDGTNTAGYNLATEAANKTDFETNFKATAYKIEDIFPAETTFDVIKTYADFKALIVSPITWADVNYADETKFYDIYLLTAEAL
jgi:hypothetical protein